MYTRTRACAHIAIVAAEWACFAVVCFKESISQKKHCSMDKDVTFFSFTLYFSITTGNNLSPERFCTPAAERKQRIQSLSHLPLL